MEYTIVQIPRVSKIRFTSFRHPTGDAENIVHLIKKTLTLSWKWHNRGFPEI